jgi:hypothetical protein
LAHAAQPGHARRRTLESGRRGQGDRSDRHRR